MVEKSLVFLMKIGYKKAPYLEDASNFLS